MIKGSPLHAETVSRFFRRQVRRTARYLCLFAAGSLVLNTLVGENGLLATLTANRLHADLSNRISSLQQENDLLRDEVNRLRAQPTAIEEIARRDLGFLREGEHLFIVSEDGVRR